MNKPKVYVGKFFVYLGHLFWHCVLSSPGII